MVDTALESEDPPLPSTIGGYAILRLLGAGAMGRVYLGRDQAGAHAAIKVLKDAGDEPWRFAKEATVLQGDFGDAVAKLYDFDVAAEPPWIAMEYFSGVTLQQRLNRQGVLSEPTAAALGMRLAAGLKLLHNNRITHRDLKPSNIMIRDSGDPAIIDFGLAIDEGVPSEDKTATRVVVGTEHWMSPEYAKGDRSDFYRADMYSLGATIAHSVTGVHPRASREFLELDGVGPKLTSLLTSLLDQNPARRPSAQTAEKRFFAIAAKDKTLGHTITEMEAELSTGTSQPTTVRRNAPPSVQNAEIAANHIRSTYTKTKDLV